MPAATQWKAFTSNVGIHNSPPTIYADGEPEGVIFAFPGTFCFENDNLWVKREGQSTTGWKQVPLDGVSLSDWVVVTKNTQAGNAAVIFDTSAAGAVAVYDNLFSHFLDNNTGGNTGIGIDNVRRGASETDIIVELRGVESVNDNHTVRLIFTSLPTAVTSL